MSIEAPPAVSLGSSSKTVNISDSTKTIYIGCQSNLITLTIQAIVNNSLALKCSASVHNLMGDLVQQLPLEHTLKCTLNVL